MKRALVVILIVLLHATCKKEEQSPANPTYFTFDGRIGAYDHSTLVSADNNLVICGNADSNICILKISKAGTQIWRKEFSAGSASAIAETADQGFLICGTTSRNYSVSSFDVLLVKTNSTGDTLWSKTYGSDREDYGSQIIKTNDNNYLISGNSYVDTTSQFPDIYLIKVNSDGDTLWTRTYQDQDNEVPWHLLQTANGEYLVTGTNQDNSQPNELYLLKVDANGTKLWDKKIGPPTGRWGFSTIELSNGDLLTCGPQSATGIGQVLLIKTDAFGNTIWEKQFGEENLSEQGTSMKQNLDGTFTITGSSYDVNTLQSDILLLKIAENGDQLWRRRFGGAQYDYGMNLLKDSNDDNIITGTLNQNPGVGTIFMTVVDSDGNFK